MTLRMSKDVQYINGDLHKQMMKRNILALENAHRNDDYKYIKKKTSNKAFVKTIICSFSL
jgi:hypothetical protein